ncbi:MAG: hypothetical protein WCC86_06505 [Methanoregula sp.]|uniref:hypothetical protein n=1 Tax=Methanoregula sp. TaxID=2052170 RepID=UPI003BAE26D1
MIRKFKTGMQGPVMVYRLSTPVDTIIESIETERKNLKAYQVATIRKLRSYLHASPTLT